MAIRILMEKKITYARGRKDTGAVRKKITSKGKEVESNAVCLGNRREIERDEQRRKEKVDMDRVGPGPIHRGIPRLLGR